MICARCDQPITEGQLYHQARRRSDSEWANIYDEIVTVHEGNCPQRFEIINGRVIINGHDIGPVEQYDTAHIAWPEGFPGFANTPDTPTKP
jgi:hypothetical protein